MIFLLVICISKTYYITTSQLLIGPVIITILLHIKKKNFS